MSERVRKHKPRVLIVDDEEQNLTIFRGAFRRDLTVLTASSAQEGLDLLEKEDEPIPVIITDQKMPQMTGVDFLVQVRERWPDSIRMVLTAYTDVDAIIDAINRGNVYKFIYKPWDKDELLTTILNANETYELRMRNQALTEELLNKERLATVGRLVSGMAHEIGNQLTALTVANLIIKQHASDEGLVEKVTMIRNALQMIHSMVRELRDFSKARNRDLDLARGLLHETVNETLSLLSYDQDVSRCAIEVELDQEVGAMIHQDKIQQVLINLIKNAAQSIPPEKGDGKIRVELAQADDAATLRVTDNGSGIPEELRERIWEPFFTTKEERGTGLGLDICQQIIHAHGGTIRCDTGSEEGTTFEIRVPTTNGDGA